ncbi:MAG: hypothetical protein NVSMB45_05040 [Ginsengibacter sp.]
MAFSLISEIEKDLNIHGLQKIDPNTLEVKKPDEMSYSNFLNQAAIPVVLIGLYKFTRTDAGNLSILSGYSSGNLMSLIFGDKKYEVLEKVANYTGNTSLDTENRMEAIGQSAIKSIRKHLTGNPTERSVKDLLNGHRHEFLSYLPSSIQIGKILNDESIDDRTNKMEGPVSDLMHKIGQVFSSSGNDSKKEENF